MGRFYYLETMFNACGTEIIIVKDADEEKTVQDELVEDMMSLIASFSWKLYGMRSKRPKVKKENKRDEEGQESRRT